MSVRNGAHAAPASTFRVEVAGRPGFADAAGASLAAQLPALGVPAAFEIRVCPIYEVTGRFSNQQAELTAKELLADPVTQEYRLGESALGPGFLLGPHWRVEVWLKPGVSDPVEASVRKGMVDLGLPAPEKVRCGTAYKLLGRCQPAQVERIARKLLSNPVIHRYTIASP